MAFSVLFLLYSVYTLFLFGSAPALAAQQSLPGNGDGSIVTVTVKKTTTYCQPSTTVGPVTLSSVSVPIVSNSVAPLSCISNTCFQALEGNAASECSSLPVVTVTPATSIVTVTVRPTAIVTSIASNNFTRFATQTNNATIQTIKTLTSTDLFTSSVFVTDIVTSDITDVSTQISTETDVYTSFVDLTLTQTDDFTSTSTQTDYESTTLTLTPIVSVTETVTSVSTAEATVTADMVAAKRGVAVATPLPTYPAQCGSFQAYSSACACHGIAASTITAPTPLSTVTVTALQNQTVISWANRTATITTATTYAILNTTTIHTSIVPETTRLTFVRPTTVVNTLNVTEVATRTASATLDVTAIAVVTVTETLDFYNTQPITTFATRTIGAVSTVTTTVCPSATYGVYGVSVGNSGTANFQQASGSGIVDQVGCCTNCFNTPGCVGWVYWMGTCYDVIQKVGTPDGATCPNGLGTYTFDVDPSETDLVGGSGLCHI